MKPPQQFFIRSVQLILSPRRYVRVVLERGLVAVRQRPEWKGRMLAVLRFVPPLERRLWRFAALRNTAPASVAVYAPAWFIDADPATLAAWRRIAVPLTGPDEGDIAP